ncbi:MAG: transcription antitermination protein NusB [Actinomycetota bacterium]
MANDRAGSRPDRRSEAREQALGLLYEASSKNVDVRSVVAQLIVPADEMVGNLVSGVAERSVEIDALIGEYSRDWAIARMPAIDVIILRMAVFELLARVDVPTPVVIDEAVELAKTFSTDDSGRFVNGMLSAIAKDSRVRGQ